MEQSAFKTVIDLVEVSKLVELSELLKHLVVEECVAYSTPMAPTGHTEEHTYAEAHSVIRRSAGTLHRSYRYGHRLEQAMPNYNFEQSEADTETPLMQFSAHQATVLLLSSMPLILMAILRQLPGIFVSRESMRQYYVGANGMSG